MANWIIGGVLLLIVGGAAYYIYKAKKSGKKCVGCPDAANCSRCGCCANAEQSDETE